MSKKEQLITFDTAKLAKDKGFKLGIGWHGFEDWFYDKDGNKYQFLQEVNPNTENGAHDIYCEYKGVKVLNNRSKIY